MSARGTALVTGATGYIGSRLVAPLLDAGWRVRVLSRDASRLERRAWYADVEIVEGDAGSSEDVSRALDGVDVAYFLLHSMDGAGDFASRDRDLATRFASIARAQGVRRIVYLGGLHPAGEELSPHLASRKEVGDVFLDSPVPAAVLQAAVIVGSGSASFEMMRHLAERLPVMVAPRWIRNRIQPIAVRDVLRYLVAAADLPGDVDRAFDIGGPDVLTYDAMLQRFSRIAGLQRRLIVPVPVLTPDLAGRWVGLVTPLESGLARPLVDSLVHEVVCDEHDIRALTGTNESDLLSFDDAVRAALRDVESDASAETEDPALSHDADPDWAGTSSLSDIDRGAVVDGEPEQVWERLLTTAGGPSLLSRWSRGLRASGLPVYDDAQRSDRWTVNPERHTVVARQQPSLLRPGRLAVTVAVRPEGTRSASSRVTVDFDFLPQGATGHVARLALTPALVPVHAALRRRLTAGLAR